MRDLDKGILRQIYHLLRLIREDNLTGEGKSTSALALVRTAAKSNQKCLVIDCDMRHPSLHEAFMSRPAEEGEEVGVIVEEFLRGYRMGDRIIRATKGVVAAAAETAEGDDESPEEV